MNVFDKFLVGEISGINWCFENRHFLERLNENGITREYVVECLFEMEPKTYEHDAPQNKDYKEIRLIMSCSNNSIDLITIMRNNETTTNRQNKQFQSQKKKSIEKKRLKALSKRKW